MTMLEKITLKPCPFCGGKDILEFGPQKYGYATVECRSCRAKTCDCFELETAIAHWNTRADLVPAVDLGMVLDMLKYATKSTNSSYSHYQSVIEVVEYLEAAGVK